MALTLEQVIADTRHAGEPSGLVKAKKILIEAAETNRKVNRQFGFYGIDNVANFLQNIGGKDRLTLYNEAKRLLAPVQELKVSEGGTDYTPHYADEAEFLSKYATLRSQLVERDFTSAFVTLADTIAFLDVNMDHRKDLKTSLILDQARAFMGAGVYGRALDILGHDVDDLVSNGEKSFLTGEINFRQGKYSDAANEFRAAYARNPKREGLKDKLVEVYNILANNTPNPIEDYSGIDKAITDKWKEGESKFRQGSVRDARAKFDEVVTALGAPANEAEKAMKARALHYQAMVSRIERDYKTAIELLTQSIAVIATPNAYKNLAETYKIMSK